MIDQLREKVDLISRESSEQTSAIASLQRGLEVLQLGRQYDSKEISSLVSRLTKEVEELTAWRHASYRAMWEGDQSIGARLKELERNMKERCEEHDGLDGQIKTLRQDMERVRDSVPKIIDDAISRREVGFDGRIRLERTRGFWALVAAVAVALASAMGLVIKQWAES